LLFVKLKAVLSICFEKSPFVVFCLPSIPPFLMGLDALSGSFMQLYRHMEEASDGAARTRHALLSAHAGSKLFGHNESHI
jgi:hypothetical protein